MLLLGKIIKAFWFLNYQNNLLKVFKITIKRVFCIIQALKKKQNIYVYLNYVTSDILNFKLCLILLVIIIIISSIVINFSF